MASNLTKPDPTPITGGCHCKSIRYTITPEPYESKPSEMDPSGKPLTFPSIDICHCQICRSVTTAVFSTWLGVPISWVTFSFRNTASPDPQDVREVDGQDILDQYLVANPNHPKEPEQGGMVQYPESTLTFYATSDAAVRSHCAKCGTGIFFAGTGDIEASKREMRWKVRDMLHLLWGTMDSKFLEEERVQPSVHCWYSDAVGFVKKGVKEGEGWGELRAEW